MPRTLSTVLALLCFTAGSGAQSEDPLQSAMKHLERAEYAEAVKHFEKAIDAYALTERLDEARRVYMDMFVGNRAGASLLMRAMKSWVERHRGAPGNVPVQKFAEFDAWVQERDALAVATINLIHNSPDWK